MNKIRSVADEVSAEVQLQAAVAALRVAKAKQGGLRDALRRADGEVKVASQAFREALAAHTGLQFRSMSFGEGLDLE